MLFSECVRWWPSAAAPTRERPDKADDDYLPASVVIYSQGDAEALDTLLRSVPRRTTRGIRG